MSNFIQSEKKLSEGSTYKNPATPLYSNSLLLHQNPLMLQAITQNSQRLSEISLTDRTIQREIQLPGKFAKDFYTEKLESLTIKIPVSDISIEYLGEITHMRNKMIEIVERLADKYYITFDAEASRGGMLQSIENEDREEALSPALRRMYNQTMERTENSSWTFEELRACEIACSRFGKVLGHTRKQPITSLGKMTTPLFGEFAATHPETKNITLFDNIEDQTQEELTFTMIHELTHGLLGDYTEYFRNHIGFWIWVNDFDGGDYDPDNYDGERPPTYYGQSAPEEDLAECVAMYFSDNRSKLKLKREYPEHFKLVESILARENIINLQAQRSKKRR